VHFLTDVQFNTAQRQDVTVVLKDPRSRRALYELAHMPGVMRAEDVRIVPVRLRSAQRSRRIGLVGLSRDATLARVIDTRLRPITLPDDGIVLVDALAAALDVHRGDTLSIDVLEGARPTRSALVADIVTDYLGLGAYMDRTALNRLMREGPVMSGAYLHVDSAMAPALYRTLKTTPGFASVALSNVARKSFEDTLAAVIGAVTTMFGLFGAAIAFAVIYNNNRIVFTERARELGSLHVLGFSHAEMAEILLGEMAILTLLGLPLGILTGRVLGALVVTLFSTELARIPLVIAPSTNAIAVTITMMSALVSGFAMWRQLVQLDVVAVLKAPE
jgi:putative ABC transport system permease protein